MKRSASAHWRTRSRALRVSTINLKLPATEAEHQREEGNGSWRRKQYSELFPPAYKRRAFSATSRPVVFRPMMFRCFFRTSRDFAILDTKGTARRPRAPLPAQELEEFWVVWPDGWWASARWQSRGSGHS